jgi:hypothetical protein
LVKRLGADASKGDVGSAAMLLKLRAHGEKYGDIKPSRGICEWPEMGVADGAFRF